MDRSTSCQNFFPRTPQPVPSNLLESMEAESPAPLEPFLNPWRPKPSRASLPCRHEPPRARCHPLPRSLQPLYPPRCSSSPPPNPSRLPLQRHCDARGLATAPRPRRPSAAAFARSRLTSRAPPATPSAAAQSWILLLCKHGERIKMPKREINWTNSIFFNN